MNLWMAEDYASCEASRVVDFVIPLDTTLIGVVLKRCSVFSNFDRYCAHESWRSSRAA